MKGDGFGVRCSKEMTHALAVFAIFMVSGWETAWAESGPVVQVEQGRLQGKEVTSAPGKTFYSFQGIPYAKPPVGALRYRDAEEPAAWSGTRNATEEGCRCPQMSTAGAEVDGCEDCLLLNVYTPQLPEAGSEPLPVMFWIHGGGYVSGSGDARTYGPDFLVAEGVVLVTTNYRLGSLGFLFLKKAAPGNVGLKDQLRALRWVQKNIHAFNGDCYKVTLFGESAGASSVHWHMLSPMSKGLFHGAIAQSGGAMSPWGIQDEPYVTSVRLARAVGCSQEGDEQIIECLRGVDFELLIKSQEHALIQRDRDRLAVFPFVPTIEEQEVWGVETFVPGPPESLIKHGCQHDVPFLAGINDEEWILLVAMNETIFSTEENLKALDSNWTKYVLPETRLLQDSQDAPAAMEDLRKFFLQGQQLSFENLRGYQTMFTDLTFGENMYFTIKYTAISHKKKVFFYSFTVDQDLNFLKYQLNSQLPGAAHADDVGYLFKVDYLPDVSPDSPSYVTRLRMVRLWTNFAKFGNPTPNEDPLIGEKWEPYTTEEKNYFEIGDELRAGKDLNKDRVEFWDNFYKKYGIKLKNSGWCPTFSYISVFSFFSWIF